MPGEDGVDDDGGVGGGGDEGDNGDDGPGPRARAPLAWPKTRGLPARRALCLKPG